MEFEFGYDLIESAWGQGYAREAITGVLLHLLFPQYAKLGEFQLLASKNLHLPLRESLTLLRLQAPCQLVRRLLILGDASLRP